MHGRVVGTGADAGGLDGIEKCLRLKKAQLSFVGWLVGWWVGWLIGKVGIPFSRFLVPELDRTASYLTYLGSC